MQILCKFTALDALDTPSYILFSITCGNKWNATSACEQSPGTARTNPVVKTEGWKCVWQYLAGTPKQKKQKDLSPASMECYSSHSMGKIGCDAVLFAMGHPASKTSWYSRPHGNNSKTGGHETGSPACMQTVMTHVSRLKAVEFLQLRRHTLLHTDIHTSYSHVHIDILNIEHVQGHQCDRCHHFDSCTCPAHGTI